MDNKQLLGNALEDVLYDKFMLELADCQENAKCSRKHFQAMREIIGCKIKKIGSHSRRIIAAILVAATLLLVGCVAYVYREEIKGFFVEFHDDHMEIVPDDEAKNSITEVYQPTYIPPTFNLIKQSSSMATVYYQWENANGSIIEFYQKPAGSSSYDSEHGEQQTMDLNGTIVYFVNSNTSNYFIWSRDGYMFRIYTNYEIQQHELENIINGIEIVK